VYLFVCLSVCLSARISQKPQVQISPNFLYVSPVAVAWSFSIDSNVICCVLVILWMTSCYRIVEGICPNKRRSYSLSGSPGGGTGGEVCRLRLHLVCIYVYTLAFLCQNVMFNRPLLTQYHFFHQSGSHGQNGMLWGLPVEKSSNQLMQTCSWAVKLLIT